MILVMWVMESQNENEHFENLLLFIYRLLVDRIIYGNNSVFVRIKMHYHHLQNLCLLYEIFDLVEVLKVALE
jgi:hypothetical protein